MWGHFLMFNDHGPSAFIFPLFNFTSSLSDPQAMQYKLNHHFIDNLTILGRHLTEIRRDQEDNIVKTSSQSLLNSIMKLEQVHVQTILCKLHVMFNVNNENCNRNDIRVNYEFWKMGGTDGVSTGNNVNSEKESSGRGFDGLFVTDRESRDSEKESSRRGSDGLSFGTDRVYRDYVVLFYARRLFGTMEYYFRCLAGSDICNCMSFCDRSECVAKCENSRCRRQCGRARCITHCKSKEKIMKK